MGGSWGVRGDGGEGWGRGDGEETINHLSTHTPSSQTTHLVPACCLSWCSSLSISKHTRSSSKFLWTSVFQLGEVEVRGGGRGRRRGRRGEGREAEGKEGGGEEEWSVGNKGGTVRKRMKS